MNDARSGGVISLLVLPRFDMRFLLADRFPRALLRGSFAALILSSIGQALSMLLQVVFARYAGETEYGIYSYTIAWLGFGLILGKLGFDTGLVRLVARYGSKGQGNLTLSVWRFASRRSYIVSIVTGPLLAVAAWWMARPASSSLSWALIVFAIVLPVAAFGELASAALRGMRKIASSMFSDAVIRPLVALGLFFVIAKAVTPVGAMAMACYAVAIVIGAVVTWLLLRSALPRLPYRKTSRRLRKAWGATAATLMFANAFLILLYTVDTILVGSLAGPRDAGHYAVASKLALLVLFVMNAVQAIGGPMLAEAHTLGRFPEFRRLVRWLNLLSLLAAFPLACTMFFASDWLLAMFGKGFVSAEPVLWVLVAMQVINVATGPTGALLSMTGHQRELSKLLAGGLVLNVVLCCLLIPKLGALGAAWAGLIAHSAWNLVAVFVVRRLLFIDCTALDWLRPVAAPARAN